MDLMTKVEDMTVWVLLPPENPEYYLNDWLTSDASTPELIYEISSDGLVLESDLHVRSDGTPFFWKDSSFHKVRKKPKPPFEEIVIGVLPCSSTPGEEMVQKAIRTCIRILGQSGIYWPGGEPPAATNAP